MMLPLFLISIFFYFFRLINDRLEKLTNFVTHFVYKPVNLWSLSWFIVCKISLQIFSSSSSIWAIKIFKYLFSEHYNNIVVWCCIVLYVVVGVYCKWKYHLLFYNKILHWEENTGVKKNIWPYLAIYVDI